MREADYIVFKRQYPTTLKSVPKLDTRFLKRGIKLMVIQDDYFMVCTRAKTEKK